MDVTQALHDAENALRDFIGAMLSEKHGQDWLEQCGVTPARLEKWRERKNAEPRRQLSGVVEERLIYYADFYDLSTILKANWQTFSAVFGEWKTMAVLLGELEKLRDPDAHRRELLPHQKHLAIGIAGEIRNRIVRYRSKMETADDCFPRIESVRDSLGNIWTPSAPLAGMQLVITGCDLRPGDKIQFVVTATDPEDMPLEYALSTAMLGDSWGPSNSFEIEVTEKDIGRRYYVLAKIRSPRPYHASGRHDDSVQFSYRVLPRAPT